MQTMKPNSGTGHALSETYAELFLELANKLTRLFDGSEDISRIAYIREATNRKMN